MKILITRLMKLEILRYLVSGGSAAVTNITILFVLVHFFHIWYLLAAIVSYVTAIYVSFVMHKFFTFNDYTKNKIRRQTSMHVGIQVFNISINTLLMYVSVDLLHIHYIISQVLSGTGIALYSFLVYKHLVFTSGVNKETEHDHNPVPIMRPDQE